MFRSITVLAMATTLAAPALVQAQQPLTLAPLVEFGGGMHAGAEACGGYTAAELQKMKEQQKAQSLKQGLSASEFEASFQKGYESGKARLASASGAERTKACEQLKALGSVQLR
jgi:hypothetical protein